MSPRRLVLEAPRRLGYRDVPSRLLAAGEVRVRALLSGISHGTELHDFRGSAPFGSQVFDPELRVFAPGEVSSAGPVELGYEMVGEIVEVGPDVAGWEVGDLVHSATPHQEETILVAGGVTPIGYPPVRLPASVGPQEGVFLSLGSVALFAIHDAGIQVGDRVVVFGLGTIGLLCVQLARLSGASVVVGVDPIAARGELAGRLGADELVDPGAVERVGVVVSRQLGDGGADVAVETSGSDLALHDAIASVRMAGRVVTVGFYQDGAPALRLGEEWHHNRPTMVSSMGVWGCPHRDHPRWDRGRVIRTVADLLARDALRIEGLLTHVVPFDDAARAYALIDEHPEDTVKVALSYGDLR